MGELARVEKWAQALIRLHLDETWSFGFDSAKRRLGACNYAAKRITVSRYLVALLDDDEVHQTLLHEVAHALAGAEAGHGPRWLALARELGYVGTARHPSPGAISLAPWVGTCPAGHESYRYRAPNRQTSCGQCASRFTPTALIRWEHREVTPAMRRAARAG